MTIDTPSRRRPGRPPDAASGALRDTLLDAAEALFAERGYAATPIRLIAEHAGANPALVHYYFGCKRDLLTAVADRALEPFTTGIARLGQSDAPLIPTFVQLFVAMATAHPRLPHLIVREVLLPGGELQDYFRARFAARLGGALPALVRTAQAGGQLRGDLDPALTAVQILALCAFPFIARPLAEQVLEIDYSEAGLARLVAQTVGLLQQGLAA